MPVFPAGILLVEREPMLRRTLSKLLERSGYQVTACPDTESAAAALRSAVPPALIVVGTRVLDAETAAAAARLHRLAPAVPMLGIADEIDSARAAELPLPPGIRFLAHPFDLPDVLRAVRSELPRPRSPSASEVLEA